VLDRTRLCAAGLPCGGALYLFSRPCLVVRTKGFLCRAREGRDTFPLALPHTAQAEAGQLPASRVAVFRLAVAPRGRDPAVSKSNASGLNPSPHAHHRD